MPAYTPDWAEPTREEVLLKAGVRHLRPKLLREDAVGDVLLFRMRNGYVAKHLGLQSEVGDEARFIHAYSGLGVTESALTDPWRRRIAARFAFPDRAG
jgi:NlpC/P60 family putative phage cell wall peptidase